MPFVRLTRDKRGYEHVYLIHDASRRGKPGRPRLLYWFRTPPGIKVGREPFDDEVRRQIEALNPGVTFDWNALISTPMPPPDAERWRDRRRAERAAKQARIADEEESDGAGSSEDAQPAQAPISTAEPPDAQAAEDLEAPQETPRPQETPIRNTGVSAESPAPPLRKRRRRRGGRHRVTGEPGPPSGAPQTAASDTGRADAGVFESSNAPADSAADTSEEEASEE